MERMQRQVDKESPEKSRFFFPLERWQTKDVIILSFVSIAGSGTPTEIYSHKSVCNYQEICDLGVLEGRRWIGGKWCIRYTWGMVGGQLTQTHIACDSFSDRISTTCINDNGCHGERKHREEIRIGLLSMASVFSSPQTHPLMWQPFSSLIYLCQEKLPATYSRRE